MRPVKNPKWTRETILGALQQLHSTGHNLAPRALNRTRKRLYLEALQEFGSYREALSAAGIDPATVMRFPKMRRWTREAIIQTLQAIYAAGDAPTTRAVIKHGSYGMYEAVVREFGSWTAAVEAAGIPVTWQYTHWTHDLVLSKLAQLQAEGQDMRFSVISRKYPALRSAIRQLFGSYRVALAGLKAIPAWQSAKKLPNSFWADENNVRAIFRYVLGQEGITLEEAPQVCRKRWFEQHRLGGPLRHHYRNSPAYFFLTLYPEVIQLANLPELPKAKDLQARILTVTTEKNETEKAPTST